ncbi:MAG: cell division protein FtsZ [Dehalococcoidia bacterium]|nr:MAG: cell division protein FtsZ [Dehalococcoidia bacterium]
MVTGTGLNGRTEGVETAVENLTQIKVVGVGGGGNNAVNRMIEENIPGIDFVAVNTDAQALVRSVAPTRVRIGDRLTRGLGVGGDHTMGMLAAEESRDELAKAVDGADMIFITAGMGGGTGTGAAPVIAEVAKELGVLTVAIVTRPFSFEGVCRARVAEEGVIRLRERADSIIVIHNERLLSMCDASVSIEAAFKMVDDVLFQSVEGISEVITCSGNINLDFNDVRAIMNEAGHAWISMGYGSGETRAVDAAKAAIVSPLFDFSIERAQRILFNIIYNDLALSEVNEAANVIREVSDPNAQIIFGLATDPKIGRNVKLTLIATGFREGGDNQDSESAMMADGDDLPEFAVEEKRRSFFPWPR